MTNEEFALFEHVSNTLEQISDNVARVACALEDRNRERALELELAARYEGVGRWSATDHPNEHGHRHQDAPTNLLRRAKTLRGD